MSGVMHYQPTADFVQNGKTVHTGASDFGNVGDKLIASGMDTGYLRPFSVPGEKGTFVSVINKSTGKRETKQIANANTLFTKDAWLHYDEQLIKVARDRLRLFGELRGSAEYTIPQGWAKTVLEYERQTDAGSAHLSMDALEPDTRDRVEYDNGYLPLPIMHSGFSFSARQLATAAQTASPLDTTMLEQCGERVAEEIEKMVLGTAWSGYSFGGGSIYGYTTTPNRLTASITAATAGGWTPKTLVQEVLAMRNIMYNNKHYGPYVIYNGLNWDQYLDEDYSDNKGDNTLRQRVEAIPNINGMRTADYLSGWDLIMIQFGAKTARAVTAMNMQTVQWDAIGGLRKHWKIMAIHVPQFRDDIDTNIGLLHAS